MVERKPVSISTVAYVLGMRANKLQRWYRQHLSGFVEALESGSLYEHDLDLREEYISVPIYKPNNLGSHMAIDEKHIDGDYYTILSNKETNKVALLAQTTKARHLVTLISSMGTDKCMNVKTISRDLAQYYDWTCRQVFMNALQIGDKFHVIKKVLSAVQEIRVLYKQQHLLDLKIAYDKHKAAEHRRKLECKMNKRNYKSKRFEKRSIKLANGETLQQVLSRSRHLLFKTKSNWTNKQKARAGVLFEVFPEIEEVYNLVQEFRKWYSKKNINQPVYKLKEKLSVWYSKVEKLDNVYLINAKGTIERNEGVILNYFYEGHSNAKAETLNSHISRFTGKTFGIRNLEFFFYRLAIYFA